MHSTCLTDTTRAPLMSPSHTLSIDSSACRPPGDNTGELDRLRQAEHLKLRFLETVSHELRTPLSVIWGALPLIDPDRGMEAVGDNLSHVHNLLLKNCQRLTKIVDAMLEVTELESGSVTLVCERTDLHEVLDTALARHRELAETKGVVWDIRFNATQTQIVGDRRRLDRVFGELVHNAVKFSKDGGRVTLVTRNVPGWFELAVSNRGQVIAEDDRETIFEMFSQADPSATRKAGGCGVGLFLARTLAQLHGGRVQLMKRDGDLTTFVVRLPIEENTEGGDDAPCE